MKLCIKNPGKRFSSSLKIIHFFLEASLLILIVMGCLNAFFTPSLSNCVRIITIRNVSRIWLINGLKHFYNRKNKLTKVEKKRLTTTTMVLTDSQNESRNGFSKKKYLQLYIKITFHIIDDVQQQALGQDPSSTTAR